MKALTLLLTLGLLSFSASALAEDKHTRPEIENDIRFANAARPDLVTLSAPALREDHNTRPDIDKDMPLAEAVRRENEQYPNAQPLTEEEVISAARCIKLTHPDIKSDIYELYMRVAKERVLPRDMYFSRLTSYRTQYGHFRVDLKDLTYRGRVATTEESEEMSKTPPPSQKTLLKILSELHPNLTFSVISQREYRVGGFNYRIRTRFISTEPVSVERPR